MSDKANKTILLIDGHSNLFKAFHAIKGSLTTTRGEPTAAVYGFLSMFRRLMRDVDPDYLAVVFDASGPSHRDEIFPEYKANRDPAPPELKQQFNRVREWLDLMEVPQLEIPGYEADDILAVMALRAVDEGGEALVCSSDKDLLQIARPGIKIWREHLQKIEVLDTEGVVNKMKVRPDQVADYLALVGDTSDNIPGVPGVGAKTAAKLLAEYDSLDRILEEAPSMKKSKMAQNLVEFADQARLSQKLTQLRLDWEKPFNWENYRWEPKVTPGLIDFYREMEFRTFLEEAGGITIDQRDVNYRLVRTESGLQEVLTAIRKSGLASIDTETTDLDPFSADLVGIALSWEKNSGAYIPLRSDTDGEILPPETVRAALIPLLRDPSVKWVAHHWQFDYKILLQAGFEPTDLHADTMIMAHLLNPDRAQGIGLKMLALEQLGLKMTEITDLVGSKDDIVKMASIPIEDIAEYACQDSDVTMQLYQNYSGTIRDLEMEKLLHEVEIPLIPVLSSMEMAGVQIDRPYFKELSKKYGDQLIDLEKEIFEIAGRPFKVNSPKQVSEILFDELDLPTGKKGKSGVFSTDVTVLENLKNVHPLPAKLLEFRTIEKLKGTYVDALPKLINFQTGFIHTSFNQTIAATGRLSSSNPNLQNIPIRTEEGRRIRQGFIPKRPGWKYFSADYSQIELRILAHLSEDEALCDAFRSGADIHTTTAAKVFGITPDAVDYEMRSRAKAVNFGIVYGMSAFRLSRDFSISRKEAEQFIKDYFKVYSGVQKYIDAAIQRGRKDGFVSTMFGRRRYVPDINSRNYNARSLAERIATNTPIQGSNAEMIKLAMIRIHRRLQQEKLEAEMILQVHDELIFEAPDGEISRLRDLVREEMTEAVELRVPIKVETDFGNNWAEC